MDTLTARERQIIDLVAEGWQNKEIAAHFGLTLGYLKNRLQIIFDKVGCSNRTELAAWQLTKGNNDGQT